MAMGIVRRLLDFNAGRDPERLQMKYRAMRASPAEALLLCIGKQSHVLRALQPGEDRVTLDRSCQAWDDKAFKP